METATGVWVESSELDTSSKKGYRCSELGNSRKLGLNVKNGYTCPVVEIHVSWTLQLTFFNVLCREEFKHDGICNLREMKKILIEVFCCAISLSYICTRTKYKSLQEPSS